MAQFLSEGGGVRGEVWYGLQPETTGTEASAGELPYFRRHSPLQLVLQGRKDAGEILIAFGPTAASGMRRRHEKKASMGALHAPRGLFFQMVWPNAVTYATMCEGYIKLRDIDAALASLQLNSGGYSMHSLHDAVLSPVFIAGRLSMLVIVSAAANAAHP
eukprot:1139015-Pelagomonas_calceolata.AAC.7